MLSCYWVLPGLKIRAPKRDGVSQDQCRGKKLQARHPVVAERAERPRATRQPFVATLIAIELESEKQIAGRTRDLSLFGCYVETPMPFVRGAKGRFVVAYGDQTFTAFGKVAHVVANEGMGVVFTSVEERDQETLEGWMDRLRNS